MKTRILSLLVLMGISSITLFATPTKTEKIKVAGNCGMCKTRIEKAAHSVEGVTTADWDKERKQLTVSFDDTKTNVDKIQQAVAKVGHDTEMYKAADEVYNKLPGCCKYDRMSKQTASCCANSSKECSGDHENHESSEHSH
jgi:copper chaperone CopZ